jgi:hypothetical protein
MLSREEQVIQTFGNSEIRFRWLRLVVFVGYPPHVGCEEMAL